MGYAAVGWFSAVPGLTWLNRFFAQAATWDEMTIDNAKHRYKMKIIYDALEENGLSAQIWTEHEAAVHIHESLARLLEG